MAAASWFSRHQLICCDYSGDPGSNDKPVLWELNCSNLLKLALYDWAVRLDEPLLQAATGITHLNLHMFNLQDFRVRWQVGQLQMLYNLCHLPALERFDLSVGETLALTDCNINNHELSSGVMSAWSTTLTRLSFSGVLALESFRPLSGFTKLQHIYMNLRLGVWDAVQSGQLPFQQLQGLTFLSLCREERKTLNTDSSLSLSSSSALQELDLYSPSLNTACFQGLTGLRTLHLVVDAKFEGGATGLPAVLRPISCMQQLERLVLACGFRPGADGGVVTLGGGDAELCRAFTASRHLRYLDLSGLKLPQNAWSHLFPIGRQLPELLEFKMCFDVDLAEMPELADELLDRPELEQMVTCCPAITRLSFGSILTFKPEVSLAPLLQLHKLSDLECPCVDDVASVRVLAGMSTLTRLHVYAVSPGLSDKGLLQLTALKGLQELGLKYHPSAEYNMSIIGERWAPSEKILKATRGRHPDVWYQLLLASAATAECQAPLDWQLPGIVQELQDSGHGSTAFELARAVSRARARVAEATAVLAKAERDEGQAHAWLEEQLAADGHPYGRVWG